MPPQSYIEKLPEDLKEFVVQDNKKFAQEMLDWDEAQARKPVTPTGESSYKEGGDGDAKQERAVVKSIIFFSSILIKHRMLLGFFFYIFLLNKQSIIFSLPESLCWVATYCLLKVLFYSNVIVISIHMMMLRTY